MHASPPAARFFDEDKILNKTANNYVRKQVDTQVLTYPDAADAVMMLGGYVSTTQPAQQQQAQHSSSSSCHGGQHTEQLGIMLVL